MRIVLASSLLASLVLCSGCKPRTSPRPAPPVAQVESAAQEPAASALPVQLESFADLRILRFEVPAFAGLSRQQKLLAYYLQQAALSGRDIAYDQGFEHNLAVRRTLEAVVDSYDGNRTAPEFQALHTYLKRVWFSNGIHHHDSSIKLAPHGLSADRLADFVRAADPTKLPLAEGETVEQLIEKLTPVIFDPALAPKGVNRAPQADPVADSANHFYVGLTAAEVSAYTKERMVPNDDTPVSYGLNSQLRKLPDGQIEERVYRVDGLYGAALKECVQWLEKALTLAETPAQRKALQRLITFYRTGDLEDWDRYSVAWVEDVDSHIDLIHGFIETDGDALSLRGTYEALLQVEDPEATLRVRKLSSQAQWFEDHSPIAGAYKKKNVVGVSARVVQVLSGAGDTAISLPSGVNLPNSSWIRKRHGSKSVTVGNVLAAYEQANGDNGVLEEFAASTREIERARQVGALARALLVDLHEVIGHASGQLAPNVAQTSETLGPYAHTIEEARADLVALYYALDPKLVRLHVVRSLEVGRAAYDGYVRNALLVQLGRMAKGEELEGPHMQARKLVASWGFERGAGEAIEKLERGGKTFFAVRDYVKLRKLFAELLRELQRIESEGDREAAEKLVETYVRSIDPGLHEEARERYQVLAVAPYSGFVQPELVPVMQGDEIVDVRIEYPEDFSAQQLRLSARYSLLPTYN